MNDDDYPPGSLIAEVRRICTEAEVECRGAGELLMADWSARWAAIQEAGLRQAWEVTR